MQHPKYYNIVIFKHFWGWFTFNIDFLCSQRNVFIFVLLVSINHKLKNRKFNTDIIFFQIYPNAIWITYSVYFYCIKRISPNHLMWNVLFKHFHDVGSPTARLRYCIPILKRVQSFWLAVATKQVPYPNNKNSFSSVI